MSDDWQPVKRKGVAAPKKTDPLNKGLDAQGNVTFKFRHTLFLGGIGDLTEEDILHHFQTLYPGDMHISCEVKLGSFATVLLGNSTAVARLIEQRWIQINNRSVSLRSLQVEMKLYSLSGANPHYAQTKMHEDQVMQKLEAERNSQRAAQNAAAARAVIRHVEDRGDQPAIFTPGQEYTWFVNIKNDSQQPKILTKVESIPKNPVFIVADQIRRRKDGIGSVTLNPGESHKAKVTFKPKAEVPAHLLRISVVSYWSSGQVHSSNLTAAFADAKDNELLKPTSQAVIQAPESLVRKIIPAFPAKLSFAQGPSRAHLNVPVEPEWMHELEQYPIPTDVQMEVDKYGQYRDLNAWNVRTNYKRRLHSLLWIEEAQNKADMRQFDLVNTPIENLESFDVAGRVVFEKVTRLEVQGLAEKRPSILYNDYVYAWLPGTTDIEYEGWVYRVECEKILVVFCPEFQDLFPTGTLMNFRFTFNRMHLRVMHAALDAAQIDLIWPEASPTAKPPKYTLSTVNWFDRSIKDNQQQAQAVLSLMNNTNQHCPYLIFGPFGCGKTRTLIEIIKQVLTVGDSEKTKILCCAPSNSASDAFVEHLKSFLQPKQMFRLYAFNRSQSTVPAVCKPYTLYNSQSQLFDVPTLKDLLAYKVVITTSATAGSLVGIGVPRGHFSHIILDEAAQMWEAEALIPISLATKQTSIVMAGDEKQMGPKVSSKTVRHHKMDLSVMDRLVETSKAVYNDRKAASVCVQLVQNYRQHPGLLEFPSRTFYDGALIAKAKPGDRPDLSGWEKLPPGHAAPMLFSAVDGEDMQEGDSPSFFNRMEVLEIVDLIENLVKTQHVSGADIGVVTAFYKQTQKIRALLRDRNLREIKVGSTEEFQGHEKRALFVSTCRSSRQYYEHDKKYQLGFTENSKRVNTTFSRAASLLVVVGDPFALYIDPLWKSFIDYCQQTKCYDGPALDEEYFQQRIEQDRDRQAAAEAVIKNEEDSARIRHEVALKQQQQEQSLHEQTPSAVPPPAVPVAPPATHKLEPSTPEWKPSSEEPTRAASKVPIGKPPPAAAAAGAEKAWAEENADWQDQRQWPVPGFWPPGAEFFGAPMHTDWRAQGPLPGTLGMADMYAVPFHAPYPHTFLPPTPAPSDDSAAYTCIYRFGSEELIHYHASFGYPPMTLHDRGHYLELKVSTFNTTPEIRQTSNKIFLNLVTDPEPRVFETPSLHTSIPAGQTPKTAKLLMTISEESFAAHNVEMSSTPSLLTVILPKRIRARQGRQ